MTDLQLFQRTLITSAGLFLIIHTNQYAFAILLAPLYIAYAWTIFFRLRRRVNVWFYSLFLEFFMSRSI